MAKKAKRKSRAKAGRAKRSARTGRKGRKAAVSPAPDTPPVGRPVKGRRLIFNAGENYKVVSRNGLCTTMDGAYLDANQYSIIPDGVTAITSCKTGEVVFGKL